MMALRVQGFRGPRKEGFAYPSSPLARAWEKTCRCVLQYVCRVRREAEGKGREG